MSMSTGTKDTRTLLTVSSLFVKLPWALEKRPAEEARWEPYSSCWVAQNLRTTCSTPAALCCSEMFNERNRVITAGGRKPEAGDSNSSMWQRLQTRLMKGRPLV